MIAIRCPVELAIQRSMQDDCSILHRVQRLWWLWKKSD